MRRKTVAVVALVAALGAGAVAVGASRVTLLVLDAPERRATLVLPRSARYGMRLVESEASLCARQGPGSPLHSVYLAPEFCPLAVATSVAAPGRAWVELPYLPALRTLAMR